MKKMKPSYEEQISEDYEKGRFTSVAPTTAELKSFKEAARATFIKDRRVNVRLSSPDLMDIQARAAEEGVPYQTLIASVLHKRKTKGSDPFVFDGCSLFVFCSLHFCSAGYYDESSVDWLWRTIK